MQQILDRFIVLEGMDGAGTTTQMKAVVEAFDQAGIHCHATFEPTSSPLGTLVRSVLHKEIVTTPLALAMLFAADREDHLHNPITGITKKLDEGAIVISDRYVFSSLAYQSVECGFERVNALNQFPLPKYIIYLDTPIEDCLSRIASRDNGRDLFERQEFLALVRDNYELIFSELPDSVHLIRIPGQKSKAEISVMILKILKQHSLL